MSQSNPDLTTISIDSQFWNPKLPLYEICHRLVTDVLNIHHNFEHNGEK